MNFRTFQLKVYKYYIKLNPENDLMEECVFLDLIKNYKDRKDKYVVYEGRDARGNICYIGTTIQFPYSRWYYHSIHGKNLNFSILYRFENKEEMLSMEFNLIKKLKPKMNKIKDRKQNLNVSLTPEELSARIGNSEWCQCCLKRRVNKGYSFCYFCGKHN